MAIENLSLQMIDSGLQVKTEPNGMTTEIANVTWLRNSKPLHSWQAATGAGKATEQAS
jgi:hypothetical protein